jgi:hypothetical protein
VYQYFRPFDSGKLIEKMMQGGFLIDDVTAYFNE